MISQNPFLHDVSGNYCQSIRIGTCLSSTLLFVKSPLCKTTSRDFLPCLPIGFAQRHSQKMESGTRVMLGYLFLHGVATGWLHFFTERHNSYQQPLQFQKLVISDLGVIIGLLLLALGSYTIPCQFH